MALRRRRFPLAVAMWTGGDLLLHAFSAPLILPLRRRFRFPFPLAPPGHLPRPPPPPLAHRCHHPKPEKNRGVAMVGDCLRLARPRLWSRGDKLFLLLPTTTIIIIIIMYLSRLPLRRRVVAGAVSRLRQRVFALGPSPPPPPRRRLLRLFLSRLRRLLPHPCGEVGVVVGAMEMAIQVPHTPLDFLLLRHRRRAYRTPLPLPRRTRHSTVVVVVVCLATPRHRRPCLPPLLRTLRFHPRRFTRLPPLSGVEKSFPLRCHPPPPQESLLRNHCTATPWCRPPLPPLRHYHQPPLRLRLPCPTA